MRLLAEGQSGLSRSLQTDKEGLRLKASYGLAYLVLLTFTLSQSLRCMFPTISHALAWCKRQITPWKHHPPYTYAGTITRLRNPQLEDEKRKNSFVGSYSNHNVT